LAKRRALRAAIACRAVLSLRGDGWNEEK